MRLLIAAGLTALAVAGTASAEEASKPSKWQIGLSKPEAPADTGEAGASAEAQASTTNLPSFGWKFGLSTKLSSSPMSKPSEPVPEPVPVAVPAEAAPPAPPAAPATTPAAATAASPTPPATSKRPTSLRSSSEGPR